MKKLLLLTLNTFSATGGIEKVCRAAGKALHELAVEQSGDLAVYSMYDKSSDILTKYFPSTIFKGFAGNRVAFMLAAIRKGFNADVVILSHINLLPAGYIIKQLSPATQLVLIAHGIEVWSPLTGLKKKMFDAIDLALPVSRFTADKLQETLKFPAKKITIVNNCLDPFLSRNQTQVDDLRKRYNIPLDAPVLLSLTRLKYSEQYKGYDKIIAALPALQKTYPSIKYVIVGKYDVEEKKRLDLLMKQRGVTDCVIFTGFVPDEEVEAHFNLADVYAMPSSGEGFGIVFIEALFYGKPVIAGNKDGSVDALANGEFGLLVNPDADEEIISAIQKILSNKAAFIPNSQRLEKKFGFQTYKNAWRNVLYSPPNEAFKKPQVVAANV